MRHRMLVGAVVVAVARAGLAHHVAGEVAEVALLGIGAGDAACCLRRGQPVQGIIAEALGLGPCLVILNLGDVAHHIVGVEQVLQAGQVAGHARLQLLQAPAAIGRAPGEVDVVLLHLACAAGPQLPEIDCTPGGVLRVRHVTIG